MPMVYLSARYMPLRVGFRNASNAGLLTMVNMEQVTEMLSPSFFCTPIAQASASVYLNLHCQLGAREHSTCGYTDKTDAHGQDISIQTILNRASQC